MLLNFKTGERYTDEILKEPWCSFSSIRKGDLKPRSFIRDRGGFFLWKRLHQFSIAVVANCHTLDGLKPQDLPSYSFTAWKLELVSWATASCQQGRVPRRPSRTLSWPVAAPRGRLLPPARGPLPASSWPAVSGWVFHTAPQVLFPATSSTLKDPHGYIGPTWKSRII